MFNKKNLFVCIFFIFSISMVFSGPFWIDMGMSLEKVKQISKTMPKNLSEDAYEITPPATNNMFETYIVRIHQTYGVYLIKAVGKDISTSGYGIELKSAFNNLLTSIEKTYGKYDKTDYLLPRSIWKDPDDFMMGLLKNERYLFADWDRKHGSKLPNDLESIGIVVDALSTSKGYLTIEYYSINYEKVKTERQAKQDSVF